MSPHEEDDDNTPPTLNSLRWLLRLAIRNPQIEGVQALITDIRHTIAQREREQWQRFSRRHRTYPPVRLNIPWAESEDEGENGL
jgi:hypothetical protein